MTAHEFYLHAAGYKEPDVVIVKGKIQKEHLRLFVQPACNRCVCARQWAHIMYARAILDQTYHAHSKICAYRRKYSATRSPLLTPSLPLSVSVSFAHYLSLSCARSYSLALPVPPPSLPPSLAAHPSLPLCLAFAHTLSSLPLHVA